MDQTDSFKNRCRSKLDIITQQQLYSNLKCIDLIVFGERDPVTNGIVEHIAFEEAFSSENCLSAPAIVGAAPLTKKYPYSKQVWQEFGDSNDERNAMAFVTNEANQI